MTRSQRRQFGPSKLGTESLVDPDLDLSSDDKHIIKAQRELNKAEDIYQGLKEEHVMNPDRLRAVRTHLSEAGKHLAVADPEMDLEKIKDAIQDITVHLEMREEMEDHDRHKREYFLTNTMHRAIHIDPLTKL